MVKVKGKFVLAWKKGFGNVVREGTFNPLAKAYFRMLGGHSALCKTTQHKTKPSDKQEFRRWLYKQVDRMYKNLTIGQFILWKRFYWYARNLGWTVKKKTERKRPDEIKEVKKNMGYRAFFMHRGLRWKLLDWLYLWLKAKWRLETFTESEQEYLVIAKIVHREDVELPKEPREYKVERVRF